MAIPALASEITATKDVTDPFAPNFYYVGDTIYYEMTVENPSGNTAVNTLIEIWDTLPDGTVVYFIQDGIDPPLVQNPGDVEYFYASYEVDEADIIWIPALGGWGVKNKFEVLGYDSAGDDVQALVTKNSNVIRPCIDIEKTVDCNGDDIFGDEETWYAGDWATWRVVVTNCGEDPLLDVWVWDDLYGMLEVIPEFAPGDSRTYEYDTWVDVDTTNWAYVDGYDELGGYWYDDDDATNLVINPCIDIEKTVDCNDDGEFLDEDTGIVGDTGHWRVVVTNCGEDPLYDVEVWDDLWGYLDTIAVLSAGEIYQYDYDTVVDADTTNWAYAEGYDALGAAWYDEDDATNLVLQPCIDIQKTVDCNDDGEFLDEDTGIVGDTGHWRIVVTNCGEADLFDVMVWDTNGMVWGPFTLVAGDSVQYDYDTVVNEDTTNWAYVEGFDAAGGVWYDEDDATNLVLQPCIDIQKTVDCNDDGIFLDEDTGTAGDTGHWRIVVTNCGTADLFDVTVWDTNGMSWSPFDLAAGDSVQFDYDTIVNETTTNVAYVEGYDELGGVWYDEDDATNVVTGNEGCTPGYWKNNAKNWEASAWVGYAPGDSFEAIFGVDVTLRGNGKATYPTPTLLEALDANGGGINALARHAVAALLNISNPDIGYGIGSTAALITMVHDAIVSGDESQIDALHVLLAGYNEAGCPINQHGEPIIPDGIIV